MCQNLTFKKQCQTCVQALKFTGGPVNKMLQNSAISESTTSLRMIHKTSVIEQAGLSLLTD